MVFYVNTVEQHKYNKNLIATHPPRKNKLINSVKIYLKEYCNVTGIHGFHYLAESRSQVERMFWGTILILSFTGCLIMIYAILTKYNERPVVISFATKNTPIYSIPFPAVTVCSETKYTRSEKFDYNELVDKFQRGNESLTDKERQYLNYMTLFCNNEFNGKKIIKYGSDTITKNFFHVFNKMKPQFFIQCSFLDSKNDCQDIFKPVIVDEGLCYSFNMLDRTEIFADDVAHYHDFYKVNNSSGAYYDVESGFTKHAGKDTYPRRVLVSGADNALNIVFFHNPIDTDYFCSSYLDGFRVLIHNPVDIPRLSKHYFRVPFNQAVNVAVQPQMIKTSTAAKNLAPNKRECYLASEHPLKHFKIYTQSNCLLECLTNYTLNKCGCVAFFMPRDNKTDICGSAKLGCLSESESNLKYENWKSETEPDGTICDCKPSCTELTYNTEISHSNYNWKEFFKSTNLVSTEKFYGSYTILKIYFKAEQFMGIRRNELYGTSDLISNFGGLLGLFTGFSLISLVEIVYFSTIRIFYNTRLYGMWFSSSTDT